MKLEGIILGEINQIEKKTNTVLSQLNMGSKKAKLKRVEWILGLRE